MPYEVGDATLYRTISRVLFGFSCLALVLSILYRFILIKGAKPRNAIGELNNLIKYSILCVLLTFYDHQSILNRFPVIMEIADNTDSRSSLKWNEWVSYLLSSRAMITAPLISEPRP